MEVAEIARTARKHAVMVRIQGPDPKGLKMRKHSFYLHQDGKTTLSASGVLLPDSMRGALRILDGIWDGCHRVVVTTAFAVEPFLTVRPNAREGILPKLIMDTSIDVLMDQGDGEQSSLSEIDMNPCWLKAQLLALVEVPTSLNALQSLVTGPNGLPKNSSWGIGWSSAPSNTSSWPTATNHQKEAPPDLSSSSPLTSTSTTIALLGIHDIGLKELPHLNSSQPHKRGDLLLVIGSPFGLMSPMHFSNSVSVGAVANCLPDSSLHSSLLMADVHGLPGMEGAPVFDKHGCLSGVLTRPIKQKVSGTEIQLVITWNAIANACGYLLNDPQRDGRLHGRKNSHEPRETLSSSSNVAEGPNKCLPMFPSCHHATHSPVERAISSIVLIAVGDGTWASGILLSAEGLIMTNAHLLEPGRFGKPFPFSTTNEIGAQNVPSSCYDVFIELTQQSDGYEKKQTYQSTSLVNVDEYSSTIPNSQHYRKINVRLNDKKPWIWSEARVVYISKGPIDVALLQLEGAPYQLCPMSVDFTPPIPGLSIHIIGHGPLGPQSDAYPYVSSGIITKVIRTPSSPKLSNYISLKTRESLPIMLQTTAAVYPGMSGGAVVNSHGRMIGLVTSNARYYGGVTIPEMNFSMPIVALEPIFKFSVRQDFSILQAFDRENEVISSVWSLKPPATTVQRSLLEKKYGASKGRRFAEFLAKQNIDQGHKDKFRSVKDSKL